MNIYKISQDAAPGCGDFEFYDSAIVVALDEFVAARIHPGGGDIADGCGYDWTKNPDDVTVLFMGQAAAGTREGVLLASYNAG